MLIHKVLLHINSLFKFIVRHRNVIVLCCSIFGFAFFLLSYVLITYLHQPPNTINMLVGHYFEDYYEYLSFLKQGQQGHILLHNLFSHDDSSTYFTPWWPYLLFGFISFILHIHIPPHILYWFMSFILLSALLAVTYVAITRLFPDNKFSTSMLALYLIMFSTSLFTINFKNGITIIPIDFWYSNGNPFARYNIGTLHHQTAHLVFLIGILYIIYYVNHPHKRKLTIVLLVFSLLLLSLSPPQLFLFWGAYLVSTLVWIFLKTQKEENLRKKWVNIKRTFLPFSLSCIVCIPFLVLLRKYSLSAPAYVATTSWDIRNLYFPPFDILALTTGPLFILALLGIPYYFKEVTFAKILFFFIALISFLAIAMPVSIFGKNIFTILGFFNLRMITPHSYIFLGVSTMFLFLKILKKKNVIFVASCIVMLLYVPSIVTLWKQNNAGIYAVGYLQYMPTDTYKSITSLEKITDGSVILTSPSSSLGIAVPALTGRKVFIGRTFFTLDWDKKIEIAKKFYTLTMSSEEAHQFLSKNTIRYIIVFQQETDYLQISQKYGLHTLSSNNFITILSPNEQNSVN